MAEFKGEEFKFPHESEDKGKPEEEKVEYEVEGEAEVEVVDDTPPEDRGRTPMKEPPAEVTDDELAQYSEGVKKRIQHFSKGYHEERRAKEAAQREKEEAIRLAQSLLEENKKLQGSLGQGQAALLDQAKKVVANEVEQAKAKLKAAHEAGDTEAFIAAQEELTAAKIRSERVNNFKPPALQPEKTAVQPAPAPTPTVPVDTRAVEWQKKNSWFGTDEEMTGFALALHNKLVRTGLDPKSDDYYHRIDSRMREKFPEAFDEVVDAPPPPPRKSSVVAPASRSTAPKKIVITKTAEALAKRLGLPLEVYARQVAEEMRKQNG